MARLLLQRVPYGELRSFRHQQKEADMKYLKLSTLVAALVAVVLVAGCSTNQSLGTQLDDTSITSRVKAKLVADSQINPFKIDVDTNEGVVRLSGAVDQRDVRARAAELARSTDGVVRVINDIEIGDRSMGEQLDDATITTKIKAKLTADPDINPFNVNVDSEDGMVTLTGRVADRERKMLAERLARETKGVRGVRNLLEVGEERSSG
jgi:hyperosmotically inducible protein